ncbi:MAG: carbamoyltransferase C-terminal domain-containing protein [Candidatus Bilamarchaeaceae archaeon]
MNIIGIHVGHNATVALIKDNVLTCAISEEKFTNIKNTGGFPERSLTYMFNSYNLSPSDIDYVVFSSSYYRPGGAKFTNILPASLNDIRRIDLVRDVLSLGIRYAPGVHHIHRAIRNILGSLSCGIDQGAFKKMMKTKFGFKESQILFNLHHLSHAFAPVGFFNLHKSHEPILIITQDGSGDFLSGTVGVYENGKYTMLNKIDASDSVARLYESITLYLGMKPGEHEYKIMGLAPYASPKYALPLYEKQFKDLVNVSDGNISLKYKLFLPYAFCKYVFQERLHEERFDNIAFCIQKLIEDTTIKFVLDNIKRYKIKKVAFGGGLFMNVKLNKKIQELSEVEKCYFMPSAGDESVAIGAAFWALENKGEFGKSDEVVYLGKEYSDAEIERYLSERNLDKKYEIEHVKDAEKEVVELVNEGKIVGRFCGRGEWGARSLGNRAILADPSKLESIELINNTIKCRDFWMPFACSVLDSHFEEYAHPSHKSMPFYMITTFDTTEKGKNNLKAAIHRKDYTMRPNVVIAKHNQRYWKLLNHYKELSGIGGILNTSLNVHGYPLVGFIDELFFTLDNSDLKYAQCGNFMIRKKEVKK